MARYSSQDMHLRVDKGIAMAIYATLTSTSEKYYHVPATYAKPFIRSLVKAGWLLSDWRASLPSQNTHVNTDSYSTMSHVPFLAVQPDAQFDSDVKTRDFGNDIVNDIVNSTAMDVTAEAPEAPYLPTMPVERLPSWVRLPIVILISFSFSMAAYTVVADWTGYELAAVSRAVTADEYVAVFVAWRVAVLAMGWFVGYDYKDLTSLALLANMPYYFLLVNFYSIDLGAASLALLIDVSAVGIPFFFMRRLDHAHDTQPSKTPNQEVAQDAYVWGLQALFGSTIYAVVVYASLISWLPVYIVTHFDEVRTMQGAHDASVPALIAVLVPVGVATAQFLFTPAIGSRGNPGLTDPALKPEATDFDPESASFAETLAWNIGFGKDGFTKRAEVLAKRTAVLVASSVVNTFVRTILTVEGSEAVGALGWAGVWGLAAGLTGLAFSWTVNE